MGGVVAVNITRSFVGKKQRHVLSLKQQIQMTFWIYCQNSDTKKSRHSPGKNALKCTPNIYIAKDAATYLDALYNAAHISGGC